MIPGGTTESIAHFIGYLHLSDDPVRSHQIYDGSAYAGRTQAWSTTPQREFGSDRSLEDLQGHRIPQAYNPGDFKLIAVPMTSTMAVDAGHNQLANLASIAVGGTTSGFQFVGGQHYDDAILVQANLVSDKAQVTIGDTHTLASEVIAFTGLHDAGTNGPEHVASLPVDSSLHHDLFHGIMT